MKKIDSRANPLFKALKSLTSAANIKKERMLLVAGRKLVPEYLKLKDMRHKFLLISDPKQVEQLSFDQSLDVIWLKQDLFDEVDEAGTHFPILVLEAPALPLANLTIPPNDLEVVLAFSNPLNLGAALRSCEAFMAKKVILLKECAYPYLPKVIRSSSGSSLKIRVETGPSITELTDKMTEFMTALDLKGEPITTAKLNQNTRIFIGEEGRGIPLGMRFEKVLSIPIKENMDSLNAVAATSIALFAIRNTRK